MDYTSPSNYFDLDADGNIDLGSNDAFKNELRSLPIVNQLHENNTPLDLYSYKFYETEDYWWILMIYNDILDPDDTGIVTVSGPSLGEIERLLAKYNKYI